MAENSLKLVREGTNMTEEKGYISSAYLTTTQKAALYETALYKGLNADSSSTVEVA